MPTPPPTTFAESVASVNADAPRLRALTSELGTYTDANDEEVKTWPQFVSELGDIEAFVGLAQQYRDETYAAANIAGSYDSKAAFNDALAAMGGVPDGLYLVLRDESRSGHEVFYRVVGNVATFVVDRSGGAAATFADIALLTAAYPFTYVDTLCHTSRSVGGGARYLLDLTDTTTPASIYGGVTVDAIGRRWKLSPDTAWDVRQFGALPNDRSKGLFNSFAIEAAARYVYSTYGGGRIGSGGIGVYWMDARTTNPRGINFSGVKNVEFYGTPASIWAKNEEWFGANPGSFPDWHQLLCIGCKNVKFTDFTVDGRMPAAAAYLTETLTATYSGGTTLSISGSAKYAANKQYYLFTPEARYTVTITAFPTPTTATLSAAISGSPTIPAGTPLIPVVQEQMHSLYFGCGAVFSQLAGATEYNLVRGMTFTGHRGDGIFFIGEDGGVGFDCQHITVEHCLFLMPYTFPSKTTVAARIADAFARSGTAAQRNTNHIVQVFNLFSGSPDQSFDAEATGAPPEKGPTRFRFSFNLVLSYHGDYAVTPSGLASRSPMRDSECAGNIIIGGSLRTSYTERTLVSGNFVDNGLGSTPPFSTLGYTVSTKFESNFGIAAAGWQGFVAPAFTRSFTHVNSYDSDATTVYFSPTLAESLIVGAYIGYLAAARSIVFTTVTGTFAAGETVTQAGSGATGRVISYTVGTKTLVVAPYKTSADFNNSGTVTGATSAASGTTPTALTYSTSSRYFRRKVVAVDYTTNAATLDASPHGVGYKIEMPAGLYLRNQAGGSIAVNDVVTQTGSGAFGRVTAVSATPLGAVVTVDVAFGSFVAGQPISTAGGKSADVNDINAAIVTLGSITGGAIAVGNSLTQGTALVTGTVREISGANYTIARTGGTYGWSTSSTTVVSNGAGVTARVTAVPIMATRSYLANMQHDGSEVNGNQLFLTGTGQTTARGIEFMALGDGLRVGRNRVWSESPGNDRGIHVATAPTIPALGMGAHITENWCSGFRYPVSHTLDDIDQQAMYGLIVAENIGLVGALAYVFVNHAGVGTYVDPGPNDGMLVANNTGYPKAPHLAVGSSTRTPYLCVRGAPGSADAEYHIFSGTTPNGLITAAKSAKAYIPGNTVVTGIHWHNRDGTNTGWVPTEGLQGSVSAAVNLAAGASTTITVPVAGVALGDFAMPSVSVSLAGLDRSTYVTATDSTAIRYANNTGATVNLGTVTHRVRALKQ